MKRKIYQYYSNLSYLGLFYFLIFLISSCEKSATDNDNFKQIISSNEKDTLTQYIEKLTEKEFDHPAFSEDFFDDFYYKNEYDKFDRETVIEIALSLNYKVLQETEEKETSSLNLSVLSVFNDLNGWDPKHVLVKFLIKIKDIPVNIPKGEIFVTPVLSMSPLILLIDDKPKTIELKGSIDPALQAAQIHNVKEVLKVRDFDLGLRSNENTRIAFNYIPLELLRKIIDAKQVEGRLGESLEFSLTAEQLEALRDFYNRMQIEKLNNNNNLRK